MEQQEIPKPPKKESAHSNFREAMFEHRFIAELMEYCWQIEFFDVQVLHAETDDSGYDLVISLGKKTSHLQFKVTKTSTRVPNFPIHARLPEKENAFIFLSEYEDDHHIDSSLKYMMRISKVEWDKGTEVRNSHNKIRKDVRMISRTKVKGGGPLDIEGIFKTLGGKAMKDA